MFNLFGGFKTYYASGGANDFIKSFETLEEAVNFASKQFNETFENDVESNYLDWWHVTDSKMQIISESKHGPYNASEGFVHKIVSYV